MEFLEDLKKINQITDGQFKNLLQQINTNRFETITDLTVFNKFCKKIEIDLETGKSIRRLLNFIFDYIIEHQDPEETIINFEKDIIKNYEDEDEIKKSWSKIKENIKFLDKFLIIRKEKLLRSRIPNIEDFSLVCEIRPIFDMHKTSIEKLICPIIMRIKDSEDEKPKIIEMDEESLFRIKKEIDFAIKKLELIKEKYLNGIS